MKKALFLFILIGSTALVVIAQRRAGMTILSEVSALSDSNGASPQERGTNSKSAVREVPSPSRSTSPASMHEIVERLREDLYRGDIDYAKREIEVRAALENFDSVALISLAREVRLGRLSRDQTRVALYLIGEAEEKGVDALAEIIMPSVTATSKQDKEFVFSIQLGALEQLETLSSYSPKAENAIIEAARRIQDRSLRSLAQIAVLGLKQGRPGKLHRFLEQSLKEKGA